MDGTRLVVYFNEALDAASAPVGSAFSVVATVNSVDTTIVGTGTAAIAGARVTVTLAEAVAETATVTLGYSKPTTGNKLRDAATNEVATFTGQTVSNDPAPWFSSAAVDGRVLTVTFDEALDAASAPAGSTFSVSATASGTTRSIDGTGTAAISGGGVSVTLASAVKRTETVTVGYAKPDSGNKLRDAATNEVATFSGESVTNHSQPPTFLRATVRGDDLVIDFSEYLDIARVAHEWVRAASADAWVLRAGPSSTPVDERPRIGLIYDDVNPNPLDHQLFPTLERDVSRGHVVTLSYTEPESDGFQDRNGNQVESFSNASVTNSTSSNQPLFESAAVIRRGLVLTFSHGLDPRNNGRPPTTAFTVTVTTAAGVTAARAVNRVNVPRDSKTVTLTLASAVTHTDTVKVRYTKPGGVTTDNKLRSTADLNAIEAPTFDDQPVTNNTPDTTAPEFESAAVDGTQLTLTFDENLDTGSKPAPSDFFVTVGTARRNVAAGGVAIAGATVTLTLASAVTHTDKVKVRYTRPSSNRLRDTASTPNVVATFPDQPVTNNTPDTTPPEFESAAVDGTQLTLTFDENLDTGSQPAPGDFTVSVGTPFTVRRDVAENGVAIAGATVTLTLASAVTHTDTVQVRYIPHLSRPLRDVARNNVASFLNQPVTNNTQDTTPPVFQRAEVTKARLTLTFDEALDPSSRPAPSTFFVTVGTARRDVAAGGVAIAGATVTLTLASAVIHTDTVKVRYDKPSSNRLRDTASTPNVVATFGDKTVSNNTAQIPAPLFQRAAVNGTQLTITFDENLATDSVPAPGDFHVSVGGTRRDVAEDGVAIAGATVTLTLVSAVTDADGEVTVGYTQPAENPLRAPDDGDDVATFSNEPVTNNTDNTPPRFSSARVDGRWLIIIFDENLVPSHDRWIGVSPFRVTVNGTERAVRVVSYVRFEPYPEFGLTLHPAVAPGDRVTVSYTKPESDELRPLQDAAGNEVESFSNQPVENLTQDETPPALRSAVVSGTTLTLTFDEALNPSALPPAASAFTVAGTETPTLVEAVDFLPVGGTRVLLTLSQAVLRGQSATVSYVKPGINALRDAADNEVADFENEPVTHPALPPPPSPPPPGLHTVPSFVDGENAHLSIVRRHAERAPVGTVLATDADGDPLAYSLAGDDRALFTIDATGLVAVAPGTALADEGRDAFTVTAEVSDGENALGLPEPTPAVDDTIEVTITLADTREHRVPLVPSASDPLRRQGFVRVVNHSAQAGEVSILAIDDVGMEYGPATLDLEARQTVHFNSRDLEQGNPGKGLADGTGPGEGHWRLALTSTLDLEVLSYIRTDDGFVTSMHDLAPSNEAGHRVVFFNPASNRNQVSRLRIINPGEAPADIKISGTDDAGEAGAGLVELTLGAGASRSLTAQALESGEDLRGRLGDGKGKWRLQVSAPTPVRVMSLLSSPTGHLTNLSATPGRKAAGAAAVSHRVPLAPSASDPLRRQGFVRVVNHSGEAGDVSITAIDDDGMRYGPVTLDIEAGQTVHFNSRDLEQGNPRKGLASGTGPGDGHWRLVLTSTLDLEVLSYVRTDDGFVTSMHEVAPANEAGHRVVFVNPASNRNQVSRLRIINPGEAPADITITGTDDAGVAGEGPVELTLGAGASRSLTAQALESGEGLRGRLGDGKGKWRLQVTAPQPIRVMSLLSSPTGHLTNLSAAPDRP